MLKYIYQVVGNICLFFQEVVNGIVYVTQWSSKLYYTLMHIRVVHVHCSSSIIGQDEEEQYDWSMVKLWGQD